MAHVETKAKRSVKRSLESASRREERRRREVAGRDVMVVLAAFGEGEHGVDVEARECGGARAVFELQGEARAKELLGVDAEEVARGAGALGAVERARGVSVGVEQQVSREERWGAR